MGVDYNTCANCGDCFPDCIDYFWCECGHSFCSKECGKGERKDPSKDKSSCIFCRKEACPDYEMQKFLLKQLNLTYEQALELWKNNKES